MPGFVLIAGTIWGHHLLVSPFHDNICAALVIECTVKACHRDSDIFGDETQVSSLRKLGEVACLATCLVGRVDYGARVV